MSWNYIITFRHTPAFLLMIVVFINTAICPFVFLSTLHPETVVEALETFGHDAHQHEYHVDLSQYSSHVSQLLSHANQHLSHVNQHLSRVSQLLSHVNKLLSHVNQHLSHVNQHLSCVNLHLSCVDQNLSHVNLLSSHVNQYSSHVNAIYQSILVMHLSVDLMSTLISDNVYLCVETQCPFTAVRLGLLCLSLCDVKTHAYVFTKHKHVF